MGRIKKWVLFKIAAGLLITVSLAAMALISVALYRTYDDREFSDNFQLTLLFLFIIAFFIVVIFMGICIFFIQRKYPDAELSVKNKLIFNIGFVLYFLPVLAITGFFIYGFTETVKSYNSGRPITADCCVLTGMFIFISALIYTMAASVQLRRAITRNFTERQIAEINNLGS